MKAGVRAARSAVRSLLHENGDGDEAFLKLLSGVPKAEGNWRRSKGAARREAAVSLSAHDDPGGCHFLCNFFRRKLGSQVSSVSSYVGETR